MSGGSKIVWSKEDISRINEFLRRATPDFADTAQVIVEAEREDTVYLRIEFVKNNRVVAVKDFSGNIVRVKPAEGTIESEEKYSKSKFLSLATLQDRLRILNWHVWFERSVHLFIRRIRLKHYECSSCNNYDS